MDWSLLILKIVGSIAATIITGLAGILFTKLSTKIKDSRIMSFIKECVKAAEQIYPNQGIKMGPDKYKYVSEQVIAKFPSLTNNDYLKALIEGAVFALNNELLKVEEKKNKKNKKEESKEIEISDNKESENNQTETINNSLTSF